MTREITVNVAAGETVRIVVTADTKAKKVAPSLTDANGDYRLIDAHGRPKSRIDGVILDQIFAGIPVTFTVDASTRIGGVYGLKSRMYGAINHYNASLPKDGTAAKLSIRDFFIGETDGRLYVVEKGTAGNTDVS